MPFKAAGAHLSTVGDNSFRLEGDLCYVGGKEVDGKKEDWTVPAGFETDFATVPRIIQWLIPTYGRYTLAAILHDFFCVELSKAFKEQREPFISSSDTDGIFRRVMRELGVPFAQRWLMWTGVRWGAIANKARRKGIVKDLPKMVLVSVLSSWLVVPVTLLVALGLGVAWLINILFRAFK